jgi:hypothetical protein
VTEQQNTKSRRYGVVTCLAIFVVTATAAIAVGERLLSLHVPLRGNAALAIGAVGFGFFIYKTFETSYSLPQPLESQRQTDQPSAHPD